MSLVILPASTITFEEEDIHQLILMNVGKSVVLFKFQTNNVNIFCCKPVIGRIPPNRQITVSILLKWWKIDEHVDRKILNRFRLLSCNDTRSLLTQREIDQYWRVRERIGFPPEGTNDVIRYMDVQINWQHFVERKGNKTNAEYCHHNSTHNSTPKYFRDYSVSEIDMQLETMP